MAAPFILGEERSCAERGEEESCGRREERNRAEDEYRNMERREERCPMGLNWRKLLGICVESPTLSQYPI
jgi:hypothetical protein